MMNNGFQFPVDGGPVIDGTWYNPKTEDSFTVRDSFFQDNQLMIQTTDGRMLDYNMIQSYVKTDRPIPPKQNKTTKSNQPKQLPKEIVNELEGSPAEEPEEVVAVGEGILDDDLALIQGKPQAAAKPTSTPYLGTLNTPSKQSPANELSEDERLAARVLGRAPEPDIDFSVSWAKFPYKQMEMLIDYMGVEPSLVVDYYINKLDIEEIRKNLSDCLTAFIHEKLGESGSDDVKTKKSPRKNTKKQ